jgi:hypothetical protein
MVALVTITTPLAPGKPEKLDLAAQIKKVIPTNEGFWLLDLDNRSSRKRRITEFPFHYQLNKAKRASCLS